MKTDILLYVMVFFYVVAGMNHFLNPGWYKKIIPAWVPNASAVNYLSGVCEIIFALLLIPEATRNIGACLIILLLIAVFPANIQMSINYKRQHNLYFWLTIARLPLQLILIWWVWQYISW